jgi:hypothetical protein
LFARQGLGGKPFPEPRSQRRSDRVELSFVAAPIDHQAPLRLAQMVQLSQQFGRCKQMRFDREAGDTLARAEGLNLAFVQQLEQLKTVGETHVALIIAGLAEIL